MNARAGSHWSLRSQSSVGLVNIVTLRNFPSVQDILLANTSNMTATITVTIRPTWQHKSPLLLCQMTSTITLLFCQLTTTKTTTHKKKLKISRSLSRNLKIKECKSRGDTSTNAYRSTGGVGVEDLHFSLKFIRIKFQKRQACLTAASNTHGSSPDSLSNIGSPSHNCARWVFQQEGSWVKSKTTTTATQ